MDGLVPLAFLLDDPRLVAKAHKWVAWTLENQREDGGIGPAKNQDWWPNMVMLKVLTQYQEATGDARVVPLMQKYAAYQLEKMKTIPLKEWAIYRWEDEAVSLIWLYNRTGDARALELARLLRDQGYDWKSAFDIFPYRQKSVKGATSLKTHVVNTAMGLKTAGVYSLISGDPAERASVFQALRNLDQYHGMPSGIFSGDEHLAGRSPVQGTELCAVVESLYSLENLMAVVGDGALGDRIEKIAYNALPGTFSGDMWAHQYDQQPNQVTATLERRAWTTNGPESNLYGLEPNFGCCTSNFHQGWPKLTASLWMATPDDGLAAVVYAPSQVTALVHSALVHSGVVQPGAVHTGLVQTGVTPPDPNRAGVRVTVVEETEYPFRDAIRMVVNPAQAATFPLLLRVPAWAQRATIMVNGVAEKSVKAGGFHRIERTWQAGDRVEIRLPMPVEAVRGFNNGVTIQRGPLVYSLKIGEEWRKLRDKAPAADWEVRPATPWNYALVVDDKRPAQSLRFTERPVGQWPFTPDGAPVTVAAKARRLPEWGMEGGSAAPPPESPVKSGEPLETVTLIPYGAAKLRITVFPVR
ncbi:MAG TPA: beta-L-arabinofuranosidase domain-containing protein [Candidatus Acidoferrales bacterium]|nr:beta-L-arabinofuranosidase domain-containing protein [Candidatus Acidoferrales bacterium]